MSLLIMFLTVEGYRRSKIRRFSEQSVEKVRMLMRKEHRSSGSKINKGERYRNASSRRSSCVSSCHQTAPNANRASSAESYLIFLRRPIFIIQICDYATDDRYVTNRTEGFQSPVSVLIKIFCKGGRNAEFLLDLNC